MISMLLNVDEAGGVSKGNIVPWHYAELTDFTVKLTHDVTCIMGLSMYEFMYNMWGQDACDWLVEDRECIVVTEQIDKITDGRIKTAPHFAEALRVATRPDILCSGSSAIFRQALPFVKEVYLNTIPGDYGCDNKISDVVATVKVLFTEVSSIQTESNLIMAKYRRD